MLQSIREHTQGWIAGTIVTLIIITFALWGIHSYFGGNENANLAAVVNGVDITKQQFAVTYERFRRQAQMQYGENHVITSKDEALLKTRSLQALIELEVLKQASSRYGFAIFNDQIDNYIENLPDFQVDGRFSVNRFKEILSSSLLSTSEFFDLIRTSLLIEQPKLGILLTSFATSQEIDYTISLVNQERNFNFITFPLQFFSRAVNTLSDKQINAYYEKHKNYFMTPEQVSVDYLQLSLKDLIPGIQVSDNALKEFYNENINSYLQPMAWKLQLIAIPFAENMPSQEIEQKQAEAEKVLKLIRNGENFTLIQKKFPNPFKLPENEFLTLSTVPVELQKEVALLVKPNQISSLIQTKNAFVIVKANAVKNPKIQDFNEVQQKVKDAYVRQRVEEKFLALRDQLASLTYENPDDLKVAAKALSLEINSSETFSKDKPGKDISQYKKVRDAAFSNDVLNLKNNSDTIVINSETIIVLRVRNHVLPTLLPLTSIRKQIEEKLHAEIAVNKAAQFAEDFKKQLEAGVDPIQFSKKYHLEWKNSGYLGRYSTKVDSAILDMAFRLPSKVNRPLAKPSFGVVKLPQAYTIVHLLGVKNGVAASDQQQVVFAEQVQNSQGLLEYELYKQSQMKQANIQIY